MENMLDKLAAELSYDALARNKVAELAKSNGLVVDVNESIDGYIDEKCATVDVPPAYMHVDMRLFIGAKDGQKFVIGIPPRPTPSTKPFMVTKEITSVERFNDGAYRINNAAGTVVFHPYRRG